MKHTFATITALLTLAIASTHAAIVSGSFTGSIDTVDAALPSFSIGNTASGLFTYDTIGHTDINAGSSVGVFVGPSPGLLTLQFAAGVFAPPTLSGGGQLRTSHFPGIVSRFGSTTESLDSNPVIDGFELLNVLFTFEDSTGTQTSSDALPSSFAYSDGQFSFQFRDLATQSVFPVISGTITSASATPEPTAASLVLLSLGAMLGRRRR